MTDVQKLLAVYTRFSRAIADLPDLRARELHELALGVLTFVAEVRARDPRPTDSEIAAGLEEALWEMPDLMADVSDDWRWCVSRAWHDALEAEHPGFLVLDAERLSKVTASGRIGSEAEFCLVRHRIDVLEGQPELGEELGPLYALVRGYGAGP